MAETPPLGNRDRLVAAAADIALDLLADASRHEDGGLTWKSLGSDFSIYSGAAGTALFFASLYRVTGSAEARECSLTSILAARRRFAAEGSGGEGIGGLVGLGSLIYAFVTLGRLLDAPELVAEASAMAALITSKRIAQDQNGDVLLGSAGAILALLALDRLSPGRDANGRTPLDRASACARHLLDRRVSYEGRPRAWAAPGRPPLSGFAHGASGIASALLRLWTHTEEPDLLAAAREGLAYERTLYDAEQGNWRDLPLPDRPLLLAWCYGAPGIALARLSAMGCVDDPEFPTELDTALVSTRVLALSPEDHLCCGNLGRVEVLLQASQQLGRADLLRAAVSLSFGVLRRAQSRGGYGLPPVADGGIPPSLFKGLAGIGYSFLHLADPGALPCLLLME